MYKVLFSIFSVITISSFAQEQTMVDKHKQSLDATKDSYIETNNIVNALGKLKISGYIQTQYQHADSNGISSFEGGNFPAQSQNRFQVRRGRVKIAYTGNHTGYVLQFDASTGGFEIKDVYMTLTDPLIKSVTLQGGIFNRPFGYEIEYSSSSRETPERSRMFQTLFPGERDLGAAIEAKSESGIFSIINLKGGFFNGTRNNVAENDNNKDFIGKLSFRLPLDKESGLELDFGLSTYQGKVIRDYMTKPSNAATTVGSVNGSSVIVPATTKNTQNYTFETKDGGYTKTDSSWFPSVKRQYYGVDFKLYIPYFVGTKILAEYITGLQPGTKSSSIYYTPGNGDLYLRKFSGYYITLIQNINKHFQIIGRYDIYDPNIGISGNQIVTSGDIKFTTIGGGIAYLHDRNLKFTIYYDKVSNETSSGLKGFDSDIKDNVITIRAQYKF